MKKNCIILCIALIVIPVSSPSLSSAQNTQVQQSENELVTDQEIVYDDELYSIEDPSLQYIQSQDYTYYITNEAKKEISISAISNVYDELVIPTEIDGYKVTGLGILNDSFFIFEEGGYQPSEKYRIIAQEDLNKITSLIIPEGIIQVGIYAFKDLSQLKDITLPTSLERICLGSFANTGIEEIEIPLNVTKIRMHAFSGCKSLKKVTINSSSVIFDDEYPPFKSCDSLSEVVWNNTGVIDMVGFRLNSVNKIVIPYSIKSTILSYALNVPTLILEGKETIITLSADYNKLCNKDLNIILPKNSVAIPTIKKMDVNYKEVSLPSTPTIKINKVKSGSTQRNKITWNKQGDVSNYQIYYSKTKNGKYKLLKETNKLSYTTTKLTGYIKVRGYKIYGGINWYGSYKTVKL